MIHHQQIQFATDSIKNTRVKITEDQWRLNYHVTAPAFWMNDPNGFCMFNNEFHLFYQHHPYSAEWGPMHWGHVKSKDLVHWEHLPIALAPSESYDQDGCFSGSAIEKDGKLYLFYTGNRWTGTNPDTDLKQVQCLAVSEDGTLFEKMADNPVIADAPSGDVHPFHFRDPKVWKKEDYYYSVVGSQTNDRGGQVLLYRSKDLISWEFLNVAAKGKGNMGYMWECPDLFQLDGYDVLVMSPQGVKPEGDLYHNLHQSVYALGDLDVDKGIFDFNHFQPLDYGFDFYAPQTTFDDKGNRILLAWMAMWESDMPEQGDYWAGAITIPRIISIEDGQLKSVPVPELKSLRYDHISYENVEVESEYTFEGVEGTSLELNVVIDSKDASAFGMRVRCNESETEETELLYDVKQEVFILDRNHSGAGPGGIRRAPLSLKDGRLHLRVFIDQSSLEVFLQNGEKVMAARIYPSKNSEGIQFFSDDKIEMVQLDKWTLNQSIDVTEFNK